MSSRALRECPTCHRAFDEHTLEAMGLRNGIALNALCPGRNGPSDIDNVIHNAWHPDGHRIMFLEFKRNGASLSGGQKMMLDALSGDWEERNDGRRLSIRWHVLDAHSNDPETELRPVVDWVWPS